METNTIILLIGLLMVFIGIFGGGLQIREIKVPKVNVLSRLVGFIVGAFLIIWSQNILTGILPNLSSKPEDSVNIDPKEPPGIDDVKNIYDELENAWKNPDFENDFLLKEYIKLDTSEVKQQLSLVMRNTLTKRIESLQNSINDFKTLEAMDGSDTLTVIEKLHLWKNHNIERLSTKDQNNVQKQKKKYENSIAEWASIKNPEKNFITCRNVKNLNPVHPSKQFDKKVYVWARVNAPGTENLKLQWVDPASNKVLKTVYPVEVRENLGKGFRTHYWKNFYEPGIYEVRLFNSQEQLIGRREFQIDQLTSKFP